MGPSVLKDHTFSPVARSSAYRVWSSDPMKTRPSTTAAEDLTGPRVLNDQSRCKGLSSFPAATPRRAGPPRTIGQSAPGADRLATLAQATIRNVRNAPPDAPTRHLRESGTPEDRTRLTIRRISRAA